MLLTETLRAQPATWCNDGVAFMKSVRLTIACLTAFVMASPATPAMAAASALEAESMGVSPRSAGRQYPDPSASGQTVLVLSANSAASVKLSMSSAAGIVVRAKGQACGVAPMMTVKFDGRAVSATAVTASEWTDYTTSMTIAQGVHSVELVFAIDNRQTLRGCSQSLILDKLSLAPGEATTPAAATPASLPSSYDSGLTVPFAYPDQASGRTLNVLSYGATPNSSSNNDATAIQAAITAAVPGDKVYLPNGTYHLSSTINLKSGVSLIGQSRDATVLAGTYRTGPDAVVSAAPGVTNLTVSGFKITRASGSAYSAGIRLGNTSGTQVTRIVVRDVMVEKHERFGIQLQNARHVLVENNIVRNASALDGNGSGYGVVIDQGASENNWVRNNLIGPVIRHGILLQYSAHHNLIEHNTVTGAVSGALDLHGEDEYSNEIRYNKVTDCVRNGTTVSPNGGGIEVGEFSGVAGTTTMHDNSGPHNWIHHNEVSNCTYGLRIVNNTNYTYVEDNTFHSNSTAGVLADLAPLHHLYILRNNIYNNGNGIALFKVTQVAVQGNTVIRNGDYGLYTDPGTTGYVITGNTIADNKRNVALGSPGGTFN